jgi:photosystem II stability/assembly factor-like uncharacterized protein
MRSLAALFVLSALIVPISAQRAAIRWESTGGPVVGQQKQIIAHRGRLLLVGSGGQWWRSPDGGTNWERPEERTPWIVSANDSNLFGDAIDGVLRSSDMADSWTRCGALPVNRRIGNEVTSIAADGNRVYVSVFRVGLFRSEDQCGTWRQLETPWKLEFPPAITYANGSRVIVRAIGGSFLSTDAGNSWTLLGDRLPDALAFTTTCNGTILAGTGRGAFASRDSGRSWASIGLERRWVPAIAAPRCDEVFAAVQDSGRWTHSVFRSGDGGASWASVSNGLSGHPIIGLADDRGTVYAAGSSGAFRWSQNEWQQIGPADTTVTSLVGALWGDMFAAAGWGLFTTKEARAPWRRLLLGHDAHVSPHGPSGDATASVITVTPKGDLLVATQLGVLRSRDRGQTWRRVGLTRIVHSFAWTRSGSLLSGTENGIFRSVDDGESWIERSLGLSAFRIYSLAVAADGTVYAGTWEGEVFRSTDNGDRWRPMSGPRGRNPVHALVALRNGDLLAGGQSGLSRWDLASKSWQSIPLTTERRISVVRALMQDERGYVFAATEGDGVFVSFDEGTSWQAANEGLTANRVFSLGVDGQGHVVAGTSAGVFRGLTAQPAR